MSGEVVEYRTTRGRMALFLLGALTFVAGGVWMSQDPKASLFIHAAGYLSVVFFGLCALVYLRQTLRPAMGLRLDAEGVHVRLAAKLHGFDLPWSELYRVRAVESQGQPVVAFDAVDPAWGLADATPLVRAIRRSSVPFYGSWMGLPTRFLGVKPEAVVADVERLHRLYTPRLSAAESPIGFDPASDPKIGPAVSIRLGEGRDPAA